MRKALAFILSFTIVCGGTRERFALEKPRVANPSSFASSALAASPLFEQRSTLPAAYWARQAVGILSFATIGILGMQAESPETPQATGQTKKLVRKTKARGLSEKEKANLVQKSNTLKLMLKDLEEISAALEARYSRFHDLPVFSELIKRDPPRGDIVQEIFRATFHVKNPSDDGERFRERVLGLADKLKALHDLQEDFARAIKVTYNKEPEWTETAVDLLKREKALAATLTPWSLSAVTFPVRRWNPATASSQLFATFFYQNDDGSVRILIREILARANPSRSGEILLYLNLTPIRIDLVSLPQSTQRPTVDVALPTASAALNQVAELLINPEIHGRLISRDLAEEDFNASWPRELETIRKGLAGTNDTAPVDVFKLIDLTHSWIEDLTGLKHTERGSVEEAVRGVARRVVDTLLTAPFTVEDLDAALKRLAGDSAAFRKLFTTDTRPNETPLARAERLLTQRLKALLPKKGASLLLLTGPHHSTVIMARAA